MWSTSITLTEFADDKLASISIESPSNLRSEEGIGLLVGLWCGRLVDRIQTQQGPSEFSIGFKVGEIAVEPTGGVIANTGRLAKEESYTKIVRSVTDQSERQRRLGGGIGISLTGLFGGHAKAEADIGGKLQNNTKSSEQRQREYVCASYRVADAGHNFWRVFGIGLNEDGVLEHRIIGDDPICYINAAQEQQEMTVRVVFRCSLHDLWFQRIEGRNALSRLDARFEEAQEERNREAVATRVVALALNKTTKDVQYPARDGEVVLAAQTLVAKRQQGAHV